MHENDSKEPWCSADLFFLGNTLSRLLKKGRLPLTLNCESDSYANKGMAGGIDARFGYADG
jgi:hypothetical protein